VGSPLPGDVHCWSMRVSGLRILASAPELRIPAILNIPLGAGTEEGDGDSASGEQRATCNSETQSAADWHGLELALALALVPGLAKRQYCSRH
jgi:hypothetical protein